MTLEMLRLHHEAGSAARNHMTATTSARKPRRTRDAQESRRLLVEAAGKIFNSVGFHGTDTNRIAKAAGYTPGTFYTHFPDKKTIFLEVYQAWVDSELIDLAAGFRSKGPGHRERLARTILNHHKKWKTFRASLRALYAIDPEVRTARLAQRARQIDAVIAISVEAGREPLSRSRIYCNLLIVEVICDSIADGNLQALKIKESEMFQVLVENIGRLRTE
jgi:AcrR family transcriptional regulator